MGDKHVCSVCGADLAGKQHLKLVYENWPVEEEVIVRSRTGRERKVIRKQTKEVISAFGMECIANPDVWGKLDVFAEGPVTSDKMGELFEDIRWLGKNPIFILDAIGRCLSAAVCKQFSGEERCAHIVNPGSPWRWSEAYCYAGHPGTYRIYNKPWKERARETFSLGTILQSLKELWKATPATPAIGNYSKKALATYFGGYILVMLFYPPLMLAKAILHK